MQIRPVISALHRHKAGTLLIQGEMAEFPNFPVGKLTVKYITIKSARGHSYQACELALQQRFGGADHVAAEKEFERRGLADETG